MRNNIEQKLKAVGQNIKNFRLKNNMTQKNLATLIQKSPSYISKLENGKIDCCIYEIFKIAKVLNTPLNRLFEM